MMFQAEVLEFPFVADQPKRERSRLGKAWDNWLELRDVMAKKGVLVPTTVAAKLLDVSRQRVCTLLNEGRMDFVEVGGIRYIVEDSLVAFCKIERVNGRALNLPKTKREIWARARSKDSSK